MGFLALPRNHHLALRALEQLRYVSDRVGRKGLSLQKSETRGTMKTNVVGRARKEVMTHQLLNLSHPAHQGRRMIATLTLVLPQLLPLDRPFRRA